MTATTPLRWPTDPDEDEAAALLAQNASLFIETLEAMINATVKAVTVVRDQWDKSVWAGMRFDDLEDPDGLSLSEKIEWLGDFHAALHKWTDEATCLAALKE